MSRDEKQFGFRVWEAGSHGLPPGEAARMLMSNLFLSVCHVPPLLFPWSLQS